MARARWRLSSSNRPNAYKAHAHFGAEAMALDQQFPDLDELLATIGAAGQRLGGIDASEGAADRIE